MRKPLFVANWKMNQSLRDVESYIHILRQGVQSLSEHADLVVAPSFVFLERLGTSLSSLHVGLGAQNAFWEEKGAFTGEVSFPMLKELGVSHVILGHSERRQIFQEQDMLIAKKVQACLQHHMRPIFCVGETWEERELEQTFSVLERQLSVVLQTCKDEDLGKMIVAYEPVWAIGTGRAATEAQAQEVHYFLRTQLQKHCGRERADSMHLLYGGSMSAKNSEALLREKDIDGGLVGGASLNAEAFLEMIKKAVKRV